MAEMTPEERRIFERMPTETHKKYKQGLWLNRIIKVMQNGEDPLKLAQDMAEREVTLEQEAIRDPLTGAFNRSYMGASLGREIAMARKHHWGVGVAFLDLDDFKGLNDQEPKKHAAGDAALKKLVEIIRQTSEEDVLIGRWGGEEFVAVVPDTDQNKMREWATALGKIIREKLARESGLIRETVTASIGISLYRERDNVSSLIDRADKAMYQAKEAGKSRVVMENPGGQPEVILIQ